MLTDTLYIRPAQSSHEVGYFLTSGRRRRAEKGKVKARKVGKGTRSGRRAWRANARVAHSCRPAHATAATAGAQLTRSKSVADGPVCLRTPAILPTIRTVSARPSSYILHALGSSCPSSCAPRPRPLLLRPSDRQIPRKQCRDSLPLPIARVRERS